MYQFSAKSFHYVFKSTFYVSKWSFWGIIRKLIIFSFFWTSSEKFPALLSKLPSKCPEECFVRLEKRENLYSELRKYGGK